MSNFWNKAKGVIRDGLGMDDDPQESPVVERPQTPNNQPNRLRALVAFTRGGLGLDMPEEPETVTDEKKEEMEHLGVHQFYKHWLSTMLSNEAGAEAASQLETVALLDLAVTLSKLHAGNNKEKINQFYQDRGIGFIEELENHELVMVQKNSKNEGRLRSVLEKTMIHAVEKLPKGEHLVEMIDGKNVNLEEVITESYRLNKGFNSPEAREEVEESAHDMLKAFDQTLKNSPELNGLLREIYKRRRAHRQTTMQRSAEKDPHAKERMAKKAKGVKDAFEFRAPEAKKALETLYRLKAVNGKQAFRLLVSEKNATAKNELLNGLGLDAESMIKEFYEKEVRAKIESARTNGYLPTDFDKKALPPEGDAKEWSLFLANTVLGKKIAVALKTDFKFFAKKLTDACNGAVKAICPTPLATEATTFEDLTKKLVESDEMDAVRYVRIAMRSRLEFMGFEKGNAETGTEGKKGMLKALQELSKTPKSQIGDPKEVVKKIAKSLKESNLEYLEMEGRFNRLCHAILNHFQADGGKGGKNSGVKTAVDQCARAMDPNEEGFNKDYLVLMPIGEKESINFRNFDTSGGNAAFNLEKLLEIYAKGVKEQGLVDLSNEIETDIFKPLLIELGLQIKSQDRYESSKDLYLSEKDFEQAKALAKALQELENAPFREPKARKDEATEPHKEKHHETSDELSDEEAKLKASILKKFHETLEEKTKKEEKTEDKKEPKKQEKPKEPEKKEKPDSGYGHGH